MALTQIDKHLTKEGMVRLSAGMQEIHRVLERPADATINDVAGGKPLFRATILRDKLLAGVILDHGELFETMAGYRDDQLGLGTVQTGEISTSPGNTSRTRARTTCKDCAADIKDPSQRMKSDPARCIDCARKKKAEYNARYRNKARG